MTKKFKKDNLKKAFDKALKNLDKDEGMSASMVSAGFIISCGQKSGQRKGIQIFVKACLWDEALMKNAPETGGLIG